MKGILEIVALNKVKLVEIFLYLRPRKKFFLLIFQTGGNIVHNKKFGCKWYDWETKIYLLFVIFINGYKSIDIGSQHLWNRSLDTVMKLRNTSWSPRCDAEIKTSSKMIIMGSQGFFHGIFMLNFPTRPSKNFKLC